MAIHVYRNICIKWLDSRQLMCLEQISILATDHNSHSGVKFPSPSPNLSQIVGKKAKLTQDQHLEQLYPTLWPDHSLHCIFTQTASYHISLRVTLAPACRIKKQWFSITVHHMESAYQEVEQQQGALYFTVGDVATGTYLVFNRKWCGNNG